jgi:ring-1,2-phenylacetyl-CoA epoxidase subunit PaaD
MVKTVSRPAVRPDDFVVSSGLLATALRRFFGVRPARQARRRDTQAVWSALAAIPDPEIPVISIVDLGIVRGIEWQDDAPVITVTPTYSGCPATEVIMADISRALTAAGFAKHRLEIRLAPAWTTDWITAGARERLAEFGIAPPGTRAVAAARVIDTSALRHRVAREPVPCPRCGSTRTRELSRFGSTPCKAQHRCDDCLEPFDYFKPH